MAAGSLSSAETAALLAGLQYGDSQFPGGAFAFSWGLEGLAGDNHLGRAALADFLRGQIENRWLTFDRPIIEAAARAFEDVDALAELDRTIDAWTPGEAQRDGSSRAGRALVGVHARLGSAPAAAYRAHADTRSLPCHLPLATGLVLAAAGLPHGGIAAVAAHGQIAGFATAAVRLGLASHLDAQRAIAAVRPVLAAGLAEPCAAVGDLHAFTPLADIAMMRHPARELRLFSN